MKTIIDKDLADRISSGEKIPVERGCNSKDGCFCTGKCREIIGWYVNGKFIRNTSNHADTTKYYPLNNNKKQLP